MYWVKEAATSIPHIIFGLLLLFAGRKLFWLSVGIIGFLVGIDYATALVPSAGGWQVVILPLLFGTLGAIFAIVSEWVTIMLIGFLGGGYFLINISSLITGQIQSPEWMFIIGGIVGVLVMFIAFDWALIAISSIVGAVLIVQSFNVDESLQSVLFICGVILGILVQYLSFPPSTDRETIQIK